MKLSRRRGGFTLTELMIVVAILGIIALVATPRFAGIILKSNEAGTKGYLANMRSAIRLYYMDNDQIYPTDLSPITRPGSKYMGGGTPALFTQEHGTLYSIDLVSATDSTLDTGGWGYVNSGPDMGYFWIECSHKDLGGHIWSQL